MKTYLIICLVGIGLCGPSFLIQSAIGIKVVIENHMKQPIYVLSHLVKISHIPLLEYEDFLNSSINVYTRKDKKDLIDLYMRKDKKDLIKLYIGKNKENIVHITKCTLIRPSEIAVVSCKSLFQKHLIQLNDKNMNFDFKDICPKVHSSWELFDLQNEIPEISLIGDFYAFDYYDKKNGRLDIGLMDKIMQESSSEDEIVRVSSSEDEAEGNLKDEAHEKLIGDMYKDLKDAL